MQPETIVRSRQNPIYKQLRSLLRRDRRHQERAFIVEGPRFVFDAIGTGAVPSIVALSESLAADVDWIEARGITPRILDAELFDSLSSTVTSQGMLAVFPFPQFEVQANQVPFILIADGIQDPGNLGTLIRSAAGAGVTQVVALPGTADPWAPRTVRAAAAAHFLVPIASLDLSEVTTILPNECLLIAADASGATRYDECDLSGPLALIVGAEGSGLSASALTLEPRLVSIPLATGLESLNAGVAGSIVMFEASRQRRNRGIHPKTPVSI